MRRVVVALYGLILLVEVVNQAIVPLAPRFGDELGLSKIQLGAVLAATSVMSVVVCVPVGIWTDRLGPRRLTVGAAALAAAGTAGQALAADFWSLLGARVVFGAGFSITWTAGLVWLAQGVSAERRPKALGATITTAGAAGLAGPALAGQLAEHVGLAVPFWAASGALALATAGLLLAGGESRAAQHERQRLLATLSASRRELAITGGFVATVIGGLAAGVISLLVPLELDANGLSEGEIGVVFSAASGVFILASALVARAGERAVRVRNVGLAAAALAAVLVLVLASHSTVIVVAFVLLRAPVLAVLFTSSFPLVATGARRAGLGEGSVLGVLNLLWGVATMVGPLLAGVVASSVGDRAAYAALLVCALTTAAWVAVFASRPVGHRPAV